MLSYVLRGPALVLLNTLMGLILSRTVLGVSNTAGIVWGAVFGFLTSHWVYNGFDLGGRSGQMRHIALWMVALSCTALPPIGMTIESSMHNWWGQRIGPVRVQDLPNLPTHDQFQMSDAVLRPELGAKIYRTSKTKSGTSTSIYGAVPVLPANADLSQPVQVWAVFERYDAEPVKGAAVWLIRAHDNPDEFLAAAQDAAQRHRLRLAPQPIFVTATADVDTFMQSKRDKMTATVLVCCVFSMILGGLQYYFRTYAH
ncbi:MAG: hypothetical protein KIH69_008555 [Anaerolineae bacterium]|nr:hypothetical protein [Anaerolineae bacterium]